MPKLTATGHPAVAWICPHCRAHNTDDGRGGDYECIQCDHIVTVIHVDNPALCAGCNYRRPADNSSLCKPCREFVDYQRAKGAIPCT